jgi:hypothetical protein
MTQTQNINPGAKRIQSKSFLVNILALKSDLIAFILEKTTFNLLESTLPSQQTLLSLLLQGHFPSVQGLGMVGWGVPLTCWLKVQ